MCSDDGQFGSKTNEGGTAETLEATSEAEAMAERSEGRWWSAELHRLRGMFLAALGADERQIETAFCEAIGIANQQKSISLAKRAEATYAEYRRQKVSALGGREFAFLDRAWANKDVNVVLFVVPDGKLKKAAT